MEEQTDSRLLKILKDGSEYAEGVADAAKEELLSRGFSEEALAEFISTDPAFQNPTPGDENSPLDFIWTQYHKDKTAKGMLLMVVFLLIFSVLKTLLVYAVLHYRYGQGFSFEVSLLHIFLPMALSAFSAYTIWKLASAGWFTALLFAYGTLVRIVIELFMIFSDPFLSEQGASLWINEGAKVGLDGFIALFIIVQLSKPVHRQLLGVPYNLARTTLILLPLLSALVVTLVYFFGL